MNRLTHTAHMPALALVLSLLVVRGGSTTFVGPTRPENAQQPYVPKRYLIRPSDLPTPGVSKSVLFTPRTIPPEPLSTLKLPPGFRVTLFASGLSQPRWMAVAPNGDVFCTESLRHRLIVLRDSDGDGAADTKTVFAAKLYYPFGIAFWNEWLYVANTGSIVRFAYKPGQLNAITKPQVVVKGIPEKGYNQHWTRDILFNPAGTKLYLSIGSEKNLAEEEPHRAAILELNPDGTAMRIFAGGLRNPVGLAFNPVSGALWCTCNERDYEGNDLVPDFATAVKEGGFYGWPYYYIGRHHDARMPRKPRLAQKTIVPDVLFQAHSAPLGICFYSGSMFPAEYRGDAFVAFHGSTNRRRRTGYKIVRVPFHNGKPSGGYEDFVTGWMVAEDVREVWGRPVGIAMAPDGSLLVSDDANGRIYRISYRK